MTSLIDTLQTLAQNSQLVSFFLNIFLGAFSASVVQLIRAPIELVKLKKQTENGKSLSYYKTFCSALKNNDNDGWSFFNLWRGNTEAMIKTVPKKALELGLSDYLFGAVNVSVFISGVANLEKYITFIILLEKVICGGISGIIITLILHPLDVVRTRKAIASKIEEKYHSESDELLCAIGISEQRSNATENRIHKTCAIEDANRSVSLIVDDNVEFEKEKIRKLARSIPQTYKEDGKLASLYRGLQISLVGVFVYAGLKYGLLDFIKQEFINKGKSSIETSGWSWLIQIFGWSWFFALIAGCIAYPIDTMRRILMVDVQEKYSGWFEVFLRLKSEGRCLGKFFNGVSANILMSAVSSLVITLYKHLQTQIY